MMWIPAFVTIGFLRISVAELIMLETGLEWDTPLVRSMHFYANLWQDGFMLTGLAVAATAALFNGILSQFWYLYSIAEN